MINEITGEDEWYESPVASLLSLANALGTGLQNNRLVSGRVLSTSEQPAFLVPNGAARTIKLDGTPTSFLYYINGVQYTIATDITLTNLTAAPPRIILALSTILPHLISFIRNTLEKMGRKFQSTQWALRFQLSRENSQHLNSIMALRQNTSLHTLNRLLRS